MTGLDESDGATMSASAERWAEGPGVLASVWRYRWLVLAGAVLAGLLGYVGAQTQATVYEASTRLYLADPGTTGVFDQQSSPSLERYVPQQAEQVTSTPVLTQAAEQLGPPVTPSELRGQTSVTGDPELATIDIEVSHASPDGAAETANAIAAAYQDTVRTAEQARIERATEELEAAAADIEAQIADLDAAGEGSADGQTGVLTQRLVEIDTLAQQLRVDARLFGSGVEFSEAAAPPGEPAAPRPRRSAAGAGVLGLLLASAAAYWLAGRSRRIQGAHEPAEILGAPLLGSLPRYRPLKDGTLERRTTLEPRTTEAYRFVYSSIDMIIHETDARSVMVTSADPATGKTETALQLAATAARRGRDTLLIDADVRMRGLSHFLSADDAPGLLDLADAQTPARQSPRVVTHALGDGVDLAVMPAGRATASATHSDLGEPWIGTAIRRLAGTHALTVLDSPPLLAVADTATIAANSDAIVLVVQEGDAIGRIEQARERLRFVGDRLIGYVYISSSALADTNFDYGLVRSQAARGATRPRDPDPGRSARTLPPSPGSEAGASDPDHPRRAHQDAPGPGR